MTTAPEDGDAAGLEGVKVLEIGHFHFAKSHLPDQTTLIWTGVRPPHPDVDYARLTLFSVWGLWRRLARGEDDLVIVYVEQWAPWHWKHLRRLVCWRPAPAALRL